MLIKPIPIRYPTNAYLDTSIFGMPRHILYGADHAVGLGNFMHLKSKIYLYSMEYSKSKHILASMTEIDWSKPLKESDLIVCLYSRYFINGKSIVCRYLPNYFTVIGWITDETHFNIESILAHTMNQYRREFGYIENVVEDYFITHEFMEPFEMVDLEFAIERSREFYNIKNLLFHPGRLQNPASLKAFINKRQFRVKDENHPKNTKVKSSDPNDCECVNRIIHLPIKKLVCIYYPKKDILDIEYYHFVSSVNLTEVEQTLNYICRMYSKGIDQLTLCIDEEEIFIIMDDKEHYINIPLIELINQLIEIN